MGALRIFSRFAELLDIKVTRAAAAWLRLNADGTVTERTAAQTLSDIGAQAAGNYATGGGTATGTNTGDQTLPTRDSLGLATSDNVTFGTVAATTFTGALTGVASGNLVAGGSLGTPSSGTLTNCTFPTLNQSTTGSAARLTTARTIAGVSFDGSANIALVASDVGASAKYSSRTTSTTVVNNTTVFSDTGANVTLPAGEYFIHAFLNSSHNSTAGCQVQLLASQNVDFHGTTFRGRHSNTVTQQPGNIASTTPSASSDSAASTWIHNTVGILVVPSSTVLKLQYTQLVATVANCTAAAGSHIIAYKL